MPRDIKKTGGAKTDFSITDAMKRAKTRRNQLEAAGGMEHNSVDDLSDALDTEGMSDYEREVFEN